jgi:thiamine biosynthesis lipoprotein
VIARFALPAMATRFELALEGASEAGLRPIAEEALAEVADCEARLSRFDPGSLLSRLNREAHARWLRLDADSFELLECCRELCFASAGAFDPAAGEPGTGMRDVLLDRERSSLRFARPGPRLDLGGIAKGHALRLAAARLRERGIGRALLHGGTSTVVALGAEPVRIALAGLPLVARLRDAALSVSGLQGDGEGARRAHVRAAGSGELRRDPWLAAVIHPDPRAADAWSTALLAGAPLELLPPLAAGLLAASSGIRRREVALPDGSAFEPRSDGSPSLACA